MDHKVSGKKGEIDIERIADELCVFIDNIKNLSNEEFKNIYKHYTKVYNENFSDEKLEEYWNELAGTSYSSLEEYDDIEFYLVYGTHDIVDYIKITGEIQ